MQAAVEKNGQHPSEYKTAAHNVEIRAAEKYQRGCGPLWSPSLVSISLCIIQKRGSEVKGKTLGAYSIHISPFTPLTRHTRHILR